MIISPEQEAQIGVLIPQIEALLNIKIGLYSEMHDDAFSTLTGNDDFVLFLDNQGDKYLIEFNKHSSRFERAKDFTHYEPKNPEDVLPSELQLLEKVAQALKDEIIAEPVVHYDGKFTWFYQFIGPTLKKEFPLDEPYYHVQLDDEDYMVSISELKDQFPTLYPIVINTCPQASLV